MDCKNCGNLVSEDTNFCPNCGAKREDSSSEPIMTASGTENTVDVTNMSNQGRLGDYSFIQEDVVIPDVDPRLFDLADGHMDLTEQESERKIDLGAGLDFGAPRQSAETSPPFNTTFSAPSEQPAAESVTDLPTFVMPNAYQETSPSQGTSPRGAEPMVLATYLSDSLPAGFTLDNNSGLYFKTESKLNPITNNWTEEVTYYNLATKEVSVVAYPKAPAPPIMGYPVHSTSEQDASRNKSNRWIIIVIAILAAALVLTIIAGVIGFAGSRGSRRDTNTSSSTSSSVLESWGNRQRNSDTSDSAEESVEISFFDSYDRDDSASEEAYQDRRTTDLYPVYSPISSEEKDYFFDSPSESTFKKRMGFDGIDYYYFPNYVATEDYTEGNKDGFERYLYRMEVGSDTPQVLLDVGENNSIYSYEVFEDIVYIAVNSILDSALGSNTSCHYYVYDILSDTVVYLFSMDSQRLIGSGGYIYVNNYISNQLISIGRDENGGYAYSILKYTVPEDSYQVYSSTSVSDGKLLMCLVNMENEFTYNTYDITSRKTKELLVIDEEYLPYNAYFSDDWVFYSRHVYGTDSEETTILVVNDGVEEIVAKVPYGDSYYGAFAVFDGNFYCYYDGKEIICTPYQNTNVWSSSALDTPAEVYGFADTVFLLSTGLFELTTGASTTFKTPVESAYLMSPSWFDYAITDYNYIY